MSLPMRRRRKRQRKPNQACCGRVAYPTQGKAIGALDHIKIQNAQAVCPLESTPTDVYQCIHGYWHLTMGKGVKANG